MKNNIFDIIILGAGASGLMSASHINKDYNVGLIDTNGSIGQKIKISGGGKCNITNVKVSSENYDGDKKFIDDILNQFTQKDLLLFLKKYNLELEIRDNRFYFFKQSAKVLIDTFLKKVKQHTLLLNYKVQDVKYQNNQFIINTSKGDIFAKKVVVATGGLSYASIGASDIGYKIAKNFGHNIIKTKPALVGFTVQKEQFWFKELSGISINVTINVNNKKFNDPLLFTHKGISGPSILNASLYWQKGNLTIDFLPSLSINTINTNSKKLLSNSLFLPKRFIQSYLKANNLTDKSIFKYSKNEFEIIQNLNNYQFSPAGNFGYTKAEVTKGGVDTLEIDSKTMQSKLQKGLYFVGEVLDVTGWLGGYNFQWALSSGMVCSKNL